MVSLLKLMMSPTKFTLENHTTELQNTKQAHKDTHLIKLSNVSDLIWAEFLGHMCITGWTKRLEQLWSLMFKEY